MQNTSKIPNIPNYLVKNFFIAGVNQDILACKYTNPSTALAKILENKAYNIEPEVLFSMYQQKERVTDYLQVREVVVNRIVCLPRESRCRVQCPRSKVLHIHDN